MHANAKKGGPPANEDWRDHVIASVLSEAGAFYKLVVTTATLFLGGTLLFWERIAPAPDRFSLAILGVGWFSLGMSIMAVVIVRKSNIECGRLTLEGEMEKANRESAHSRRLTNRAAIMLAFGILCVMASGFFTMWDKATNLKESANAHVPSDDQHRPVQAP
jgi:hypothetical protein